jgi:hypothetical protein
VKETYIPVHRKVILNQLTSLQDYASWYPWIQIDPTAEITLLRDKQGLSWKSKNTKGGRGMYELTGSGGDSVLNFRLVYNTLPSITGAYILRSSEDGKGTTLVWYMNMKAGWTPWWRFYAAMMNKIAGPVMEAGLTNIKILSEKADTGSANP